MDTPATQTGQSKLLSSLLDRTTLKKKELTTEIVQSCVQESKYEVTAFVYLSPPYLYLFPVRSSY